MNIDRSSEKKLGHTGGSDCPCELCARPSKTSLDSAWAAFLRDTASDRSTWEAFQYAWLARGDLDPTFQQLEAQCQAIWRTNVTLVCQLPKGHEGDHRCGRHTFNGECDILAMRPDETDGITERDKLVAALNRLCPHRGDMPPGMYEEPCPRCLSEELEPPHTGIVHAGGPHTIHEGRRADCGLCTPVKASGELPLCDCDPDFGCKEYDPAIFRCCQQEMEKRAAQENGSEEQK